MTQSLTTLKWSIDEYHRLIADGYLNDKHVELINGDIVEMTPEGIPHADISDGADDYLRELLGDRVRLRIAKPITLPDNSEPEPDLCICQKIRYTEHHPYPENIFLLIEFSDSSLTKDLEVKSKIYATAGIREYWVINLKAMSLVVFRSAVGDQYQIERTLTEGIVTPIVFPDIEVDVARLLGKR
jgi:Uma2 family endonuclease